MRLINSSLGYIFLFFMPTLIYSYNPFGSSSYTLGIIITIFYLYCMALSYKENILRIPKKSVIYFFPLILLACQTLVVLLFESKSQVVVRSLLSFIILLYFLGGAYLFSYYYRIINQKVEFIILLVIAIVFSFQIYFFIDRDVYFLFPEPSHLSVFVSPFLIFSAIYLFLKGYVVRLVIFYAAIFSVQLIVTNATLISSTFLSILILGWLSKSRLIFPLLSIGTFFIFSLFIDLDDLSYFTNRIIFWDLETANASGLVLLSGWERAILSMLSSMGFGTGFNTFGYTGPKGDVQLILYDIYDDWKNLADGGALAPKIIGENGIIGIFFIIIYLLFFMKVARRIRTQKNETTYLFYASFYFSFFIELFVRGIGYFTITTFMFLASAFWLRGQHIGRRAHCSVRCVSG